MLLNDKSPDICDEAVAVFVNALDFAPSPDSRRFTQVYNDHSFPFAERRSERKSELPKYIDSADAFESRAFGRGRFFWLASAGRKLLKLTRS